MLVKERMRGYPREDIVRASLHFGIPEEEVGWRDIAALPTRGYGLSVAMTVLATKALDLLSGAEIPAVGGIGAGDPLLATRNYDPVVKAVGYPVPAGSLGNFMVSLDDGKTYKSPNVAPDVLTGQPFWVAILFEITQPVGYKVRTVFEIQVWKVKVGTGGQLMWTTTDQWDMPCYPYASSLTYKFTYGVPELGNWGLRVTMSGETIGPI